MLNPDGVYLGNYRYTLIHVHVGVLISSVLFAVYMYLYGKQNLLCGCLSNSICIK